MDMERLKPAVDAASLSTTVAALAGWLPSIAALVSIVWGLIRIYETRTFQCWMGKRYPKRTKKED